MGYLARDVARIPGAGFEWFVFLLEDNWSDALRNELADNFENLAREVGPQVLAVRGFERGPFAAEVLAAYALDHDPSGSRRLPALLIANQLPKDVKNDDPRVEKVKMILLPLDEQYIRPGSVSELLENVARTLRDTDSVKSLQSLDRNRIERHWGWLNRYVELKPSFMGFGVNINEIIDSLIRRAS